VSGAKQLAGALSLDGIQATKTQTFVVSLQPFTLPLFSECARVALVRVDSAG
jgi:hypothetical protein